MLGIGSILQRRGLKGFFLSSMLFPQYLDGYDASLLSEEFLLCCFSPYSSFQERNLYSSQPQLHLASMISTCKGSVCIFFDCTTFRQIATFLSQQNRKPQAEFVSPSTTPKIYSAGSLFVFLFFTIPFSLLFLYKLLLFSISPFVLFSVLKHYCCCCLKTNRI